MGTKTIRVAAVVISIVASLVTATVASESASAAPAAPSSSARESVIVVLKDQLAAQPADAAHVNTRRSETRSAQARVLGRMAGAKPTNVINYTLGNAFSATMTAAQAAQLNADPDVASVTANHLVNTAPAAASQPAATSSPTVAAPGAATVNPSTCSTNRAKPVLEPEALQTINARSSDPSAKTAASLGIDGSGVKVAYIADGINPNNAGFLRTDGTSAITDYQDFYGDGPNAPTGGGEAFGDASSIAAQGNVVYDVADFSNPNVVSYPGGHCYIKIVGVAPGADVVALKAGSELLPNSAILQAIDYAVSVDHVNVINESFGANLYPDLGARNTVQLFDDQAVAAGVTVTTSTGDSGITSTIGNPATDPKVISVGASTDSRLYEQTGYALATAFGNGKWLDNNISSLSSAGITQDGRTIDLSAPGEADWAVCDDSGNFASCVSFGNPAHPFAKIEPFGGTSQSSPLTAGVAALVIEAYRNAHHGASPTPAVVKEIITSTAHDLGLPGDEQGSGVLDARAAVEAALTWPGGSPTTSSGIGSNIALSTNQLTLEGSPGSTQTGTFSVTNVGTKPQTVSTSARDYQTVSSATQTVAISTSSTQTTPYPTTGAPWVYQKVTFTVPRGVDQLSSAIRWASGAGPGGAGPVVRMSLFTPNGTYAANTRPQGGAAPANYGLATVTDPAPGRWTAVLYTPVTGGFTGNVALQTQSLRADSVGRVSPSSVRLAPGASTTVAVRLQVAPVGGDAVNTVSVQSSGGHQVAVPVILRAIVSTRGGSGAFAGTITGGNARNFAPAQTFSYSFDVPSGKRDLDVSTSMADPLNLVEGVLVDPNGEVQSTNLFQVITGDRSMLNTVAAPMPGRWRYVVVVENPVSGNEFTQNFFGRVTFNRISVSATPVPHVIKSGTTATAQITITNRSTATMLVQTDARSGAPRAQTLSPAFGSSTLTLPQSVDDLSQLPAYLVPPDTSSVTLSDTATVPTQIELSSPLGGIDLFGDLQAAQHGALVSTATVSETTGSVGLGLWSAYVQEIGPYPDGGAPAATATVTASAVTVPIDPTVVTSTGDPFAPSLDPSASPGTFLAIAPGATGTITVQITPTGPAGQKVTGVLHLVTTPVGTPLFNTTGEVLASLRYRYTIG